MFPGPGREDSGARSAWSSPEPLRNLPKKSVFHKRKESDVNEMLLKLPGHIELANGHGERQMNLHRSAARSGASSAARRQAREVPASDCEPCARLFQFDRLFENRERLATPGGSRQGRPLAGRARLERAVASQFVAANRRYFCFSGCTRRESARNDLRDGGRDKSLFF